MTDKKLTDYEIIKALGCCIPQTDTRTCKECPIKKGENNGKWCDTLLLENALDIINRKDEEINRLQAEKQNLEVELKAMRGAANSYKAENERLRKRLDLSVGMDNTKNNGCFPFD